MDSANSIVSRARIIQVGDSLGTSLLNLSLQRLIMVAGANRDFALAHSDNTVARWGGAPAAYADVIFVFTMVERLIMQWAGPKARIKKFGPLKIMDFLIAGFDVIASGDVEQVQPCTGPDGAEWVEVVAKIELTQSNGRKGVSGVATILVPTV